jgi:hypothetical protein
VERAREWAKSSNATLREWAIAVFEDVEAGNFTLDLEMLAADLDPWVASKAKEALERHKERNPKR